MTTFVATIYVFYDRPPGPPGAAPGRQVVGAHYASIEFECLCSHVDEAGDPAPEIDPGRDAARIRLAGHPEAEPPWVAVAPPLDDAYLLPPSFHVRRARCDEGDGLLFFVSASGGYNPMLPNQPYTFLDYRVAASWKICCCCDPETGETSHSVVLHRAKAYVAEEARQFIFEIEYDGRSTCDADEKRETRILDTRP